jgi:hypothetical protein
MMMSYQGRITDAAGDPVNGMLSIKFRIYDAATVGNELWSSDGYVGVQVDTGLFTHILGSSRPLPDTLYKYDSLWLGIQVFNESEMEPRTPLLTSPYSLRSAEADHSAEADSADHAERSDTAGYAETVADNSVNSAKIADGTILFEDVDQNAADSGEVMKWNNIAWTASADIGGGNAFIRWGNGSAPSGSSLIYEGWGYASHYGDYGPISPIVLSIRMEAAGSAGPPGTLWPLTTTGGGMPPGINTNSYIRAAVCYTDEPVTTVWGTHSPPSGWTVLYRGYAMGPHAASRNPVGPICVESDQFAPYAIAAAFASLYPLMTYGPALEGIYTNDNVKCIVCKKQESAKTGE